LEDESLFLRLGVAKKISFILVSFVMMLMFSFISMTAHAFVYEGFLTDSNDVPQVGAVSIKISIYFDATKACKVYEVTSDFTLVESTST
jgi:hypothetical protein